MYKYSNQNCNAYLQKTFVIQTIQNLLYKVLGHIFSMPSSLEKRQDPIPISGSQKRPLSNQGRTTAAFLIFRFSQMSLKIITSNIK